MEGSKGPSHAAAPVVGNQCEFLDAKLLHKTLDIIDKVLHVVGIDSLRFPRLIVPSHIDSHHSMCLLEMSNLVSPGIPKLWETVKKEQKWFVGVSRLHIVQLDPIDSHIVVNAKVRVNLR